MAFVTASLLLLAASFYTLMTLHSYDRKKIASLNSYWETITLGILALLLLLGTIYFAASIGFLLKSPMMKLFMKGVIVLSIPIAIIVLYGVISKVGFAVAPNGSFLNVLTYISVYWLLIYHLESFIEITRIMSYLAFLILGTSILMFATFLLMMKYREVMKRHMVQPPDMIGVLRGFTVTFTFIAIAGLSASFGLLFTHVMSDLAGALVAIFVLLEFLAEIRVFIRG